jgi:PAS domain S-box-containing protein
VSNANDNRTSIARILVVDDSADLREVFCALLQRAGYEILQAKTGAECLRIVSETPLDLVLLDVVLPDMSGIDVCKLIKRDEKTSGVLILNISGMKTSSTNAIEGLEGGADSYLTKPIDHRALLAHVNALLRSKRSEEARKRSEQALQEAHDELENKVLQRTAELTTANAFLQREIADRKRVEDALVAATAMWEQTFNAIPDYLCIMDVRGVILRANNAMRDRFECIHGDLVGLDYRVCYYTTTSPEYHDPRALTLTSGLPVACEMQFPALEGTYFVASYPLRDGSGQQWGVVSAVRDITERKQTSAALKEAEEKYRGIFENSIEGIFQSSPDGRFLSANPAIARMFGYNSPDQLISERNLARNHYVDSGRRKVFTELMEENGFVRHFEQRAYRKDGSVIWTSENVRAVRDGSGTVLYYEGIIEDITRRKEIEKERLDLLRRLVRAQEDEQRRISRELHDQMGQSLAALLLGLKSLKDVADSEPAKSQIQRLQAITNRIADEMHSLIRELRPTELDDLGLHTAMSNYIDEWSRQTNITVDFHSDGLMNHRLEGHVESTIYRIVQEALNNVLKHANAKGVSVILESKRNKASVIVEDDGIGFDAESLFKAPARNGHFGLLGMRERVMLVGGSLNIESTPGVGTTVLVHIDTSVDVLEAE